MYLIVAGASLICAIAAVVAVHMLCMKKLEDYDGFRGILKSDDDADGNLIGRL